MPAHCTGKTTEGVSSGRHLCNEMQTYWQRQRKQKTKNKSHTTQKPKPGGTDSISPEVVTLNATQNFNDRAQLQRQNTTPKQTASARRS